MKQLSSKKLFTYISLILLFVYFTFVVFTYDLFPVLHCKETCSIYYTFTYLLIAAVGFVIDTQSRKEPAFISLFTLPGFSTIYLVVSMIFVGERYNLIIVLLLVMLIVFVLGYLTYKKWINKILTIQNGYQNILFAYTILHTFIVVFFGFKILGFI